VNPLKRVLFVDDEPKVLDGLRRTLYVLRHEWRMDFVLSSTEALARLAAEPFDVIVTDMRMPDMSGADLLAEVIRLYPQMTRIVLSGSCEKEIALQSAALAHQFISKPCNAEVLKNVIDRVLVLRTMLSNPGLQTFVSRIKSLPSVPVLYYALMEAINDKDAPARKIGDIIAKDPAMSAKIIQLVNSPLFGLRRRLANPSEAAVYLGTDTLRSLALSIAVFSQFRADGPFRPSIDDLQSHSLRTAQLARRIAVSQALPQPQVEEAFLGGLLHDVGKLMLMGHDAAQYNQCIERARSADVPLPDMEHQLFGADHAEIGMYLLSLWGLSSGVVEAVALHHTTGEWDQGEKLGVAAAVLIANAVDHAATLQTAPGQELSDPMETADRLATRQVQVECKPYQLM